ncbi:unnamed protein product [Callosobruchus maculatus]|uniref:Uncharacterized protein n=1 Tax=Callosobruchus maculatus TaxID=64391 RepID=A0A653DQ62_CALMS|nr:unnamed protein product [Callosobruchus maculatus]
MSWPVCPFLFEWTNRSASGRTDGRTYIYVILLRPPEQP